MKLAIVSWHAPEPEGTSPGRSLLAFCAGALADGHEVAVWTWRPDPPKETLPDWCTWRPLPSQNWLRMKARALVKPRTDIAIAGWEPAPGFVCLADDMVSFPAVAPFHPNVLKVANLIALDAPALDRRQLRDRQDFRSETRNARAADAVVVYSDRVADAIGVPAHVVPIAYPMPDAPLPLLDRPAAVLLADWRWPPNQWALRLLLDAWPDVADRVAGAELVLAGRGLDADAAMGSGIRAMGPVPTALDALSQGSVFAFPCPASSGPKVKVIEAMAYGLPVVTTPPGAEGVWAEPGRDLVTTDEPDFASALADLLGDPERRATIATSARRAVVTHHASGPAARAKIDAISAGVAALQSDRREPER